MKFSKKRSTKLTSGGLVQHKNFTVRVDIETGSCLYIKEVGPDCLFIIQRLLHHANCEKPLIWPKSWQPPVSHPSGQLKTNPGERVLRTM